jgi:hypothetical protein
MSDAISRWTSLFKVQTGINFDNDRVRSHIHDSSVMHSDVSLFYSYTVVAETRFVIVTAPLVSLFMT